MRIVILGGGFSGVYTALRLEKIAPPDWTVTLVDEDNYLLYTPLLTEVMGGAIAPAHTVVPLRRLFKRVEFIRGRVHDVDLKYRRIVVAHGADNLTLRLTYDQLVLALGSVTDTSLIPGSEGRALTFKSLADAIGLRNTVIDRLEAAESEPDPNVRRELMSFVIIGGGFTGVELAGELHSFINGLCPDYPRVCPHELQVTVLQMLPCLVPEAGREGGDYAREVLERRGVSIRLEASVSRMSERGVELKSGECLAARTVIMTAGVAPNPLMASLPVARNPRGRILTNPYLQVTPYPGVWAIGDCACIPSPIGPPYPPTAQHAIREATVLADNLVAAAQGRPVRPFRYESLGTMASLGGIAGVAHVKHVTIKGFLAWLMWRSYYLFRLPTFGRKMRVLLDWLLGLFFYPDPVQLPIGQVTQEREGIRRTA